MRSASPELFAEQLESVVPGIRLHSVLYPEDAEGFEQARARDASHVDGDPSEGREDFGPLQQMNMSGWPPPELRITMWACPPVLKALTR